MPKSHKDELLKILQDYAPNGEAQEVCAEMVRSAEADGIKGEDLDQVLVTSLLDGFRYGNWPWVTPWWKM